MKPQTAIPDTEHLVWWTGSLEHEAEIHLALHEVASVLKFKFCLQHVSDAASLAFHRPRAPEVAFALLLPSTASWSRARSMGRQGPRALRSRAWPWGVPGLTEEQRRVVEEDNDHLRLTLEVAELLRQQYVPWVLSFPEQFGSTEGETPATIWDLEELVRWSKLHKIWRLALNQCEYGEERRRPTGILTNMALNGGRLHHGWPDLHVRKDGTEEYRGPLRKTCNCRSAHQTIPLRAHGPPWNSRPMAAFLNTVLRRVLHRELLTGQGGFGKVAIKEKPGQTALVTVRSESSEGDTTQISKPLTEKEHTIIKEKPGQTALVTVRGDSSEGDTTQILKPCTEKEHTESDSDATVPEPSSPQFYKGMPSRAQTRDLPLCKVLNVPREDRCFSFVKQALYTITSSLIVSV